LVFLWPGPGVVEVQVLDRHLVAAHEAVPPCAGATAAGVAVAAGAAAAGATGASGTPSPCRSLGAFGLASITVRVKAYGRPGSPLLASMIDSSGLVIQPALSRLRM